MNTELVYGLKQMPFQKSARYPELYKSADTVQFEGRLEYLKTTRGIGLFTGNPGVGKTAAIRDFARGLNPAMYKVIYISMTTVSVAEFFRMIAQALGLEPKYRKVDLFHQIQEEIRYQTEEKKCIPFIIIDEAQYLSNMILRDLIMFLNFEMDSKDSCILVLSGTTLLNRTLKLSMNEPLRQRVIVNYHMSGLDREEVGEYVRWCLKYSGTEEPLFSEDALEAVWRDSQGSIRKMNNLLTRSLIEGANQKKRLIDTDIVDLARADAEIE